MLKRAMNNSMINIFFTAYLILNRSGAVRKMAKQLSIKLLYLPPYSPNLNPIERLWKFMKKKIMANEHYETITDFKNALSQFFRGIRKYRSELESLLTDNFELMQA